jgi:hypothetical protein
MPDGFNYAKRIYLNKCIIGGTFFIDAINYQNGSIVSKQIIKKPSQIQNAFNYD